MGKPPQDLATIAAKFSYPLPPERIAQTPATPRDAARLLVCSAREKRFLAGTVRQLPDLLPERTLLVVNTTKVIPALLPVVRDDGTALRLLFLPPFIEGRVRALAPRAAAVGACLQHRSSGISFRVVDREGKVAILQPSCPLPPLLRLLASDGEAPLPPYLIESPLSPRQRKRRYQTVFARSAGSVAAPTASLHFTRRLLQRLRLKGHTITSVTLHVGLGTFAPLTQRELEEGVLHEEWFRIAPRAAHRIRRAQEEGRPIVAVGTTALRTLETVAARYGAIRPSSGTTNLFIRGTYPFAVATGLLTNFHMPASSLILLVDAFLGGDGTQWRMVYEEALRRGFRFLSFGDACLLWRT